MIVGGFKLINIFLCQSTGFGKCLITFTMRVTPLKIRAYQPITRVARSKAGYAGHWNLDCQHLPGQV